MSDFNHVAEGEAIPRPEPIESHPGMEDDDEAVPEPEEEQNEKGPSL